MLSLLFLVGCGAKTEPIGEGKVEPSASGGGGANSGTADRASGGAHVGVGGGTTGSGGQGARSGTESGGAQGLYQDPVLFTGEGTWIDGTRNTVGIRGGFFMFEDSVRNGQLLDDDLDHTDLDPDTGANRFREPSKFDEETKAPCVSGTLPVASVDAWEETYGGGIGVNLNEAARDRGQSPWDATTNGVTGFRFELSGEVEHAEVRFLVGDAAHPDETFCVEVPLGEEVSVLFSDLWHQCWVGGDPSFDLDPTQLLQLGWQLVTEYREIKITNFCVISLEYL